MGDMSWTVDLRGMDIGTFRRLAVELCHGLEGVSVEVELEDVDCMTAFFTLAQPEGEALKLEVSVYDMGRDGAILSVEDDCSDNGDHWDQACELAEALAERMGGELLEED